MKKGLILNFTVFSVALLIGGFSTWLLFREKPVQLRSVEKEGSIRVYTFYPGKDGKEILHGWSYFYQSDAGTAVRDEARYVDGRQVSSTHQMEAHVVNSDPAWAFKKKEPNQTVEPTPPSRGGSP